MEGLTVLVPAIKTVFDRQVDILSWQRGLVLAVAIFPTITSVAADALHPYRREVAEWQRTDSAPPAGRPYTGSNGGSASNWNHFRRDLPVAREPSVRLPGGCHGHRSTTALPSIFSTTKTLTTEIAAQMGNAMEGGEMKSALWTMALLLFAISLFFIFLIHHVTAVKPEKEEKTSTSVKTSTTAVPVKQFAAKGEN